MLVRVLLSLVLALGAVRAHGDHTFDLEDQDDTLMSYAERHVSFLTTRLQELY